VSGVDHARDGNDHDVTIAISWGIYVLLLALLTALLLRRRP
jgi:uncharacterized protein (TIGR03382 family)